MTEENAHKSLPGGLALVQKDMEALMLQNKRLESELKSTREEAEKERKRILLVLVEISDILENNLLNIEARLTHEDQKARKWIGKFRTVLRLLQREMGRFHLRPIEQLPGEKASPYWHNVVETVEDEAKETGTIVEVLKKGYLLQDKLFRPADVKAVRNTDN